MTLLVSSIDCFLIAKSSDSSVWPKVVWVILEMQQWTHAIRVAHSIYNQMLLDKELNHTSSPIFRVIRPDPPTY